MSLYPVETSFSRPGLSPFVKKCCHAKERQCPTKPFLLPVEHPPWYEKHQDYMHYSLEDKVMPAMAFWYYCDHVPDHPGSSLNFDHCNRDKTSGTGLDRPKDPWPPLPQGACPPPRECQTCGPGPWANPNLRRFFYYDCV